MKLEQTVAVLYLYCLAFRMISPLVGTFAFLHSAASRFDFILNTLGIILFLFSNRGVIHIEKDENGKLFRLFVGMLLLFNCSSLIMATVFQIVYGSHGQESAFSGILGSEIYCFQYIFIIAYNRRVFSLIPRWKIDRIIDRLCIFLLCLGYYQVLCLAIGGIFKSVLDTVDVFHILYPEYMMGKLPLTETEGASAGGIFGIFILPYLMSKILTGTDKRKYWIEIALWIPVVVFMQSTSAIFIMIGSFLPFFMLLFRRSKTALFILFMFAAISVVLYVTGFETVLSMLSAIAPENINLKYIIFEKLMDRDNASTVERMIPFYINWGAFKEWPILGCGNGLQGYFYEKYFPQSAFHVTYNVTIIKDFINAQSVIYNGSLLIPSILSGYGIVGTGMLIYYAVRSIRHVVKYREDLAHYAYYYMIACCALFVYGLQGGISGKYYVCFVLSIPYMVSKKTQCDKRII